ncbi:MAG: glycosyl hydrolase 2 galactose-binding domain-containing protein, partial [Syntrophothermus sp.]
MKKFFLLFFFCFTASAFYSTVFSQGRIDLGGRWQFRKAGTQEWLEATVPGCVHTDLMKNKLIPDPYYRDNEKKVQWVSEIGWEYKKDFNVSDTLFRIRHIELVCEGLDTYANVYINDTLIIVADNMFREWFADIRQYLRIGKNTLRIQFPEMASLNKKRYSQLPLKYPGDAKIMCRKAAYQFGWDWGPKLITAGIWKPIYFRTWTYNNLLGVQYIQRSLTDSVANMSAVFTITSTLADSVEVKVFNEKQQLVRKRALLKTGVNVVRADFKIMNPKKWWCNGMGEHPLYTLNHEVWFAGRKEASGTKKIGLRTIELVQKKDTINHSLGRSFYFKLNGV